MKYKRILLKISGEALKGNIEKGIVDFDYVLNLCKAISNLGENVKIGIVVGGGNIWRGRQNTYIDSNTSDTIGIFGTSINALILKAAFDKLEVSACLFNSFKAESLIEKIPPKEVLIKELEKNILIFGGGTGYVGCSTDTASANMAVQMNADAIIKLTNVDGIYNKDPNVYSDAIKYDKITFEEVIKKNLKVMDIESIEICQKNNIDIIVTNINTLFNLDNFMSEKNYSILKND